ncbi:MAG: C_GCAxxG_C_C family protein [Desulfobacterales bacterium]|nr:C_GCAxxG_C_C family protein [Desulfobacterales bacterium]
MPSEIEQKLNNEVVKRMISLADNNYICSQIIMILALEREGKDNPELIRAMSGLGDGCGFFNETCGILTGASCLISWYAGKGADHEQQSEKLLPMLQALGDWFGKEIDGKYRSTRCKDIVGDLVGTPDGKQICGRLLLKTYGKINEILKSYGF